MIKLFKLVWHYAQEGRPRLILFYALTTMANIILTFQPVVLDHLIESLKAGGPEVLNKGLLWCGLLGSIILVYWMLHGPSRVIERRLAFCVYRRFVNDLYAKVTALPLQWHQTHHSGDTINRVKKASKALFDYAQEQYMVILLTVRSLSCIVLMAWYSWYVALSVVVICVLILWAVRKLDRRLVDLVNQANSSEHHLSAALYDYIGNIASVLTLRLQKRTGQEIDRRFGLMKEPFWRETAYNEKKWFVLNSSTIFVQAIVIGLYIAVTLMSGKPLMIGSVVAIFQLHSMLNSVFFQAAMQGDQLLHQRTDVESVAFIEEAYAMLGAAQTTPEARPWTHLAIEGLYFKHAQSQEKLHHLSDVSLAIERGQKVALVGTSGSGKTTFLTLLRGLYEPERVRLRLDDETFDDLRPLAALTTLVTQDTEIFENTIAYNVSMGVAVTAEELHKAVFMAAFDDVVSTLPQGLATDIRERGVNLSGGQKQRLALARGLLAARESSILLLDEPTSAVDLATEGLIFDRLFTLYADKAMVVSIHRLNLLNRFDWIVLMEEGRVVQQGSFAALTQSAGPFQTLWQHYLIHTKDGDEA